MGMPSMKQMFPDTAGAEEGLRWPYTSQNLEEFIDGEQPQKAPKVQQKGKWVPKDHFMFDQSTLLF